RKGLSGIAHSAAQDLRCGPSPPPLVSALSRKGGAEADPFPPANLLGECPPNDEFGDHFGEHSGASQIIATRRFRSRGPSWSPLLCAHTPLFRGKALPRILVS